MHFREALRVSPISSSSLLDVRCRRGPGLDLVVPISVYGKVPFLRRACYCCCHSLPTNHSFHSMLLSRGASLFTTRSSGDNSKAAGKGLCLQSLEQGI